MITFFVKSNCSTLTNFTYETERGLLTSISYAAPTGSATIPATPDVEFSYDALGNRTSMDTDGISKITYQYDELSRMTGETVDFDALTENFTVGYTYHLGGALKSVTDPLNSTVNYTNDKTGRLTAVTGTAWGENTTGNYASGITYRAFGKLKQINYTLPDETAQIKMDYDSRLRVNHSEVLTNKVTGGYLMKADFSYSADSRLQAKNDWLDDKWDRTNKYDHAGRLVFNQFGMGEATDYPGTYKRVYEQNIAYDTFSMMTSRYGVHWGNNIGFAETYVNGRINKPGIVYDAAGNIGDSNANSTNPHEFQRTTYDASGRRTISHSSVKGRWGNRLNMVTEKKDVIVFDGDGHPVVEKSGYQTYHAVTGTPPPAGWQPTAGSYRIWSSVLGAGLTTIDVGSDYKETNVYAGKSVIAVKTRGVVNNQTVDQISWKTSDPVTGTEGSFGGGFAQVTEENEPLGQKIDFLDSSAPPEPSPSEIFVGSADEPEWRCMVPIDFQPYHCQMKADIANSLNGTSIIVVYDPNKKEGDPNFIHAGDPPREQTAESADDHLMHETLHSTNKPEDLDYGGSPIRSSQLPTQSGNGQPPKFKVGRKLSKEEIAIKRAIAATGIFDDEATQESRIFDDSIPGMKDSSYQGKQQIDKRIPDNLRDQVAEVDKDISCRAFIKLIYDDLKSRGEDYRSTSLVSIFDSAKVIEINPEQAGYTNGGANAVRKGNAGYIYFGAVLSQYLGKTVAELSHLGKAGSDDYSDYDLDEATGNVLGANVVSLIKAFQKQQGKKKHPGNVGHFAINVACQSAIENALR